MVPERKRDGNFTKIHGESNMWSTTHRWKKDMDLMFMLGSNGAIDPLAMANSVRWHGHVLWR